MRKILLLLTLFQLPVVAQENKMTEFQVAHVLHEAGFSYSTVSVMTCIAKHESAFDANAEHQNTNNTIDFGLLQINNVWLHDCKVTARGLKNPYLNAKCAVKVYKAQGFEAWSAFKKYKNTCLAYRLNSETRERLLASTRL